MKNLLMLAIFAILASSLGSELGDRKRRAILKAVKPRKQVQAAVVKAEGTSGELCNKMAPKLANTRKCCKENVGNFFTYGNIQDCVPEDKSDKRLLSYASYYIYVFMDNENKLDVQKMLNDDAFQTVACITQCVYKGFDLIGGDGKINYTLAAAHFSKAVPSRYRDATQPAAIMQVVTEKCRAELLAMNLTEPVTTKSGATCTVEPLIFNQCVRQTLLDNCPPSLATPKDPFCSKNLPILNMCRVFNTSITYN
ncbi:uncharacterized protein LOC132198196 [Neocloeon triangulifer]|uniref:uncharacterized protein LOC132198196 n=1 Tax=Neocloeon triangulifer TaxID=2078957 RepID=UPI00286F4EE1|nr:uncharacterized protein LOC132198196 [Neocloeon triangulifer]